MQSAQLAFESWSCEGSTSWRADHAVVHSFCDTESVILPVDNQCDSDRIHLELQYGMWRSAGNLAGTLQEVLWAKNSSVASGLSLGLSIASTSRIAHTSLRAKVFRGRIRRPMVMHGAADTMF